MKKYLCLVILIIAVGQIATGTENHKAGTTNHRGRIIEDPPLKTDSITEYLWNPSGEDWIPSGTWVDPFTYRYYYTDNLLTEIIAANATTGEFASRELLTYNNDALVVEHIYQNWDGISWVNLRKDSFDYTPAGMISNFVRQDWNGNDWQYFYGFTNYRYNELGQILYYDEIRWIADEWVLYASETWSYNSENKLQSRVNIYPDGSNRFRFLYYYHPDDLYSEWIHQIWQDEHWQDAVRRITYLDNCDDAISLIRMHWNVDLNDWQNYSRKVYHMSLDLSALKKKDILPVCHNGFTLYLPVRAAQKHLQHGDCLGKCVYNLRKFQEDITNHYKSASIMDDEIIEHDIRLFPNPFTVQLNIALNGEANNTKRIELMDLSGKIIKTYKVRGQNNFTIQRNDLPDGIYFLRIITDTIQVRKVVAE